MICQVSTFPVRKGGWLAEKNIVVLKGTTTLNNDAKHNGEILYAWCSGEISNDSVAKHSLHAWGVLGVTPQNSTMDKFKLAGQNLGGVFNCRSWHAFILL